MRDRVPLVIALLLLASCGGGGGGPAAPTPVTVTLLSNGPQESSEDAACVTGISGIVPGDADGTITGPFRAFITFPLGLPPGATVTSAVLHLRQTSVIGTPYADLGNVLVEHLDYGPSFPTCTNFAQAPLDGTGGLLSTSATLVDKTLDVTASVLADLGAARPRTQFRLRFSPLDANGDGAPDRAVFENAANGSGTGEVPRLVVTYTP